MKRLTRQNYSIGKLFEFHGKRLHIWRGSRAAWFSKEWYNWDGVTYFRFGIAHPRRHTRWAFDLHFYLRRH